MYKNVGEIKTTGMKIRDFEEAVSRLSKETGKKMEPFEVRIMKGQVRWFVCTMDNNLYVFDHNGKCYKSHCDVLPEEPCGDIFYKEKVEGVVAYHVFCRPESDFNLKFIESCT